ncbi:MAG: hypothetical protein ACU826_08675 [Gammaproteobacteria bacterium]
MLNSDNLPGNILKRVFLKNGCFEIFRRGGIVGNIPCCNIEKFPVTTLLNFRGTMKQYIQYHKVWERGNPLSFERPKAFTEDSPSKQSHALSAVENSSRVWLVFRDSPDSKNYFLAYTFKATNFDLEDGKIYVLSNPGEAEVFIPPVPLNTRNQPWFSELLKRHGNFAFGFMPLNEDGVVNLEAIRSTTPTVRR